MRFTMSFLGETTSDANPNGYLIGTAVFAVIFFIAVAMQIKADKFHPFLYWFTIIATTTVGTTLADYLTRSNGLGYTLGSAILLTCVILSLIVWKLSTGTIDIASVRTARAEIFYWVTIMFSQTLGTALGDWFAVPRVSLKRRGGRFRGRITCPCSAVLFHDGVEDYTLLDRVYPYEAARRSGWRNFLDKPYSKGGLELSRYVATAILLALIVGAIFLFPQKPAEEAH